MAGKAIKILNPGGTVSNFLIAGEPVVLEAYEVTSQRMGTTVLTAELRAAECLDDIWTLREFVEIEEGVSQGSGSGSGSGDVVTERYFLLKTPSSEKLNTDSRFIHHLEFESERDITLSNVYFCDAVMPDADDDRYQSNNYDVVFYGTLSEFMQRFNSVCARRGLSFRVEIESGVVTEPKQVSFSKYTLFQVLQESFKIWEVPFYFEGDVAYFGIEDTVVPGVDFEYGHDNHLLTIKKTNSDESFITLCTGFGSGDNLQYYYPNPTPKGWIELWCSRSGLGVIASDADMMKFADHFPLSGSMRYREVPQASLTSISTYSAISAGSGAFSLKFHAGAVGKILTLMQISVPDGGAIDGITVGYRDLAQTLTGALGNHPIGGISIRPVFCSIPGYDASYTATSVDAQLVTDYVRGDVEVWDPNTQSWDLYSEGELQQNTHTEWRDTRWWIPLKGLTTGTHVIQLNFEVTTLWQDYRMVWRTWEDTSTAENPAVSECHNENAVVELTGTLTCELMSAGSYWALEDTPVFDLSYYGITLTGVPADGDVMSQRQTQYITPSDKLCPPLYRSSLGADRWYPALNNTYLLPGSSTLYYEFANEYNPAAPREYIGEFEDIKPTIQGMTYAPYGPYDPEHPPHRIDLLKGVFFERGYNVIDLEPDGTTLVWQHFFVKLPSLGFNLFDCAIENEPMYIRMASGDCGACEFKIRVTEDQKNPVWVDSSGNLLVDEYGRVVMGEPQDRQNDTTDNEVWLSLSLDDKTYGGGPLGTMPSYEWRSGNGARPHEDDAYVLLGIRLPQAYILAAEERLKHAILQFMAEHNAEKYGYSIQFSRVYLAQNPEVRDSLSTHCALNLVYPYDVLAAPLHVATYRKKMAAGEALPEITVELSDTIEARSSGLQRRISAALQGLVIPASGTTEGDQGGPYVTVKEEDEHVEGRKVFDKGLEAGEYIEGQGGKGFGVNVEGDGRATLEVDNLTVRQRARFTQVDIESLKSVGGSIVVTPASMTCARVDVLAGGFKCYFEKDSDDGRGKANEFVAGDLATCRSFGVEAQRYYWRLVTEVGDDYIVLSNIEGEFDPDGMDAPVEGDEIVQLGNVSVLARQNAHILSAYGDEAPSITMYAGINTFSLQGRDVFSVRYKVGQTYQDCLFDTDGNVYAVYENTTGNLNYVCRRIYGPGPYDALYSDAMSPDEIPEDRVEYQDDYSHHADVTFTGFSPYYSLREPYFSNYGSMLLGDRAKTRDYIEYDNATGTLNIKANVIFKPGQSFGGLDYLLEAFPEDSTIISGGLVLSKTIALRDAGVITAGINGVPDTSALGGGIAAWFGGDMLDLEDLGPGSGSGSGSGGGNPAKTLFRFDGSGYLASGKIAWDDAGVIRLADSILIGPGSDTLATILQKLTEFDAMFVLEDETPGGDFSHRIKAKYPLYSLGYLSAGGVGTSGGGGGGGNVSWNGDAVNGYETLNVTGYEGHQRRVALYGHYHALTELFPGLSGTPSQGDTLIYGSGGWSYGEGGGGSVTPAEIREAAGTDSALGGTTIPVYISAAGTFSECSTYAGGTKVTLNSSDKGGSTAAIYAPTNAGTSGNYLSSNGLGSAPSWKAPVTTKAGVTSTSTALVTAKALYAYVSDLFGMFELEPEGNSYRIRAKYSLYSDGYLAAGGVGSGGGGGGGGATYLGQLEDVTLSGESYRQVLWRNNSGTWVNHTLAVADISDLSNTLAGYVTLNTVQTISGQKTFSAAILSSGYADIGNKYYPWGNIFIGGDRALAISDGNGNSKAIFQSNGYNDDGQGHTATILFGHGTKASHNFNYYALGHTFFLYDSSASSGERYGFQVTSYGNISHQVLRPYTNNAYSLGASDYGWANLYLATGGSVYSGSNARITVSNTARQHVTVSNDLKVVGDLWLKGSGDYGNMIVFGDRPSGPGTPYCYIGELGDDVLTLAANGLTLTSNQADINLTAREDINITAREILNLTCYEEVINVSGNVTPTAATYNLGGSSSSKYWNNLYVKRWYPKAGDSSIYVEYDTTYGAFYFHGNIVASGYISAGGVGPSS